VLEGGVTPGSDFPVFECDFGRLGILICWDMVYEEAWEAMARGGAEIVALPSASAQNVRPMAAAMRHHYYVVNSTPKTSVSVFNPIGLPIAESRLPGVLVCEIDLAYAVLHWSSALKEGRAFTRKFGSKVSHSYSVQEGTGVFWSNDPAMSIGAMMRELGLWEMPEAIERSRRAQDRARRAVKFPIRPGEPGGTEIRP
ncbi:MAG: carbon-nitrogen hydrolase family protein, partial [Candidatus Acidiferrales bacterium]